MELITKIEYLNGANGFDGYRITTNKQIIEMGIENSQWCCEDWGYFANVERDELQEYVGTGIIALRLTDAALTERGKHLVESLKGNSYHEGDIILLDVVTDRGVLQFGVYNDHNGYYGHNVYIKSQTVNFEGTI